MSAGGGSPSSKASPAKKAQQRASAEGPASGPVQKTPSAAASYWTKERMRDAKPVEKSVTGGSAPSATPPTATGSTAPARTVKTTTKQTAKPKAQADGPAGQATSPNANAANYWTPDKMDDAQPKDMGVEGDAGGNTSGLPGGPGGSTTPPPTP
jgi:hypothetical protein